MIEPIAPAPEESNVPPRAVAPNPQTPAPIRVWERLKAHKVMQWTLVYAAAAYTVLHGTEMVTDALDWPHLIVRTLTLAIFLGLPVVVLLAWYHGHKAQHRVSAGELSMLTVLLIIAGIVLWVLTPSSPNHSPGAVARPASAPSVVTASAEPPDAIPRASIAVVPFVNLTGDATKEYFSDGMAEELINSLAHVPGLKVPARTSSFAYKGRTVDIRRIAQDLGVATILEGSVRSAGEHIRVTAQLVNAQTGYHLWSQNYDREFTDIFKLQDELAAAIVEALRTNLNADLPAAITATAPTQDVEAYQLYLQARSVSNGSEQRFRRSLTLYDQALARDPRFARALAGRAWVRATFVSFGYPLPHALEDARRDAEQALALSSGLPEAHTALGITYALRGSWLKAEESFRAGIAANPTDPDIRATHVVTVLESVGQLRQAHSEAIEAYRLAPANGLAVLVLATTNSLTGHDEDAVKFGELAVELGMSPALGFTDFRRLLAEHRGRYAEAADYAIEQLSAAERSAGGAEAVKLVYTALADPTTKPAARQGLQSFVHKLKASDISPGALGESLEKFTALGALDPAYELANHWVDEAARSGTVGDIWFGLWMPEMRPFRRDPRFQALVTRLNFIDYWKRYGPPDDCELKDGRLICR